MKIFIDGRELEGQSGQTIIEVANDNGLYIPTLCYHKRLHNMGLCRICVVEVQGMKGFQPACNTLLRDNMVVHTQTQAILDARRMILELILSNGAHHCITCEGSGECQVQDIAYKLGVEKSTFPIEETAFEKDETSEGIIKDMNKCIQCYRCVKGCNYGVVNEVLDMAFRGDRTQVVCDNNIPFGQSSCVSCGECLQQCPVGALSFKKAKGKGRTWEMEKHRVTCIYCGVGCQMNVFIKDNKVIKVEGIDTIPNTEMLCVKGRFGFDFVHSEKRLTRPLIRKTKKGKLEEATWEEALDLIAGKTKEIREKHGPDALGFLASAKCSNEENFQMMKLARAVFGTNNVDHCARLCHASTVAGLATTLGSGAMTNTIEEVLRTNVALIIGSNTTETHPVFGSFIKQAAKLHGTKLIVADPRKIELTRFADIWLQQNNGSDVALLSAMMKVIIDEDLHKKEYIAQRTENFEEFKASLAEYTPEFVEKVTGIPFEKIREAAILFGKAEKACIFYSMGITQHTHGVDNVKCTANLGMLTGNIGFESTGVNPLRGQSNVQGACDMGALPVVFSGYQPVGDELANEKFSKAWGVTLNKIPGLPLTKMIPAAGEKIKMLYIMGENPMMSDPNLQHVEECLNKLDFLVVQDIFLTETTELADVVLPATTFLEKTGTYTNTERRVQLSEIALKPLAGAKDDYLILAELAERFGFQFAKTPEDIFKEMAALTPSMAGMSYARLKNDGLQWPCPNPDHPGTKYLHKDKFTRGKGLFSAISYKPSAELPDEAYPFYLSTGRILQHFHTGTMSRKSEILDALVREGFVEMHPEDARKFKLNNGDQIAVATRRGKVVTPVKITEKVKVGSLFMPFHFFEAAANQLTNDALDPIASIPEFKVCAARLENI